MSTVVLYCWCHSDGASVLLYFTCASLYYIIHAHDVKVSSRNIVVSTVIIYRSFVFYTTRFSQVFSYIILLDRHVREEVM